MDGAVNLFLAEAATKFGPEVGNDWAESAFRVSVGDVTPA